MLGAGRSRASLGPPSELLPLFDGGTRGSNQAPLAGAIRYRVECEIRTRRSTWRKTLLANEDGAPDIAAAVYCVSALHRTDPALRSRSCWSAGTHIQYEFPPRFALLAVMNP